MKLRLASALTITAIGLAVAGAAHSQAVDGANGQLVFQRSRGQDRWFHGGTWDIVAMAPDGSGKRVLAKNGFEPAASPDGRSIAFVREMPGESDPTAIWLMNADGTGQRRVTSASSWQGSPAWSADGGKLFFTRYRSVGDGQSAIFAVRIDGTALRRVTAWDSGCEDGLDASPDGRLLAFEDFDCDRPTSGRIEAIDMRGQPVRILQNLTSPPGDQLAWPGDPEWSPDGSQLAFSRIEALGYGGAYVADLDGTNVRRLSPSRLQASSPAWSSDGAWIALVRDRVLDRGYPGDIWLVRLDGTGMRRLTNTKTIDERSVTWLRDRG